MAFDTIASPAVSPSKGDKSLKLFSYCRKIQFVYERIIVLDLAVITASPPIIINTAILRPRMGMASCQYIANPPMSKSNPIAISRDLVIFLYRERRNKIFPIR